MVVNETEPVRDLASETNVDELRRWLDAPLLAVVPFGGDPAVALAGVNWAKLITEAAPGEGKLSMDSPVAGALVGRRAGDVAVVATPRGERRFKVVSVG